MSRISQDMLKFWIKFVAVLEKVYLQCQVLSRWAVILHGLHKWQEDYFIIYILEEHEDKGAYVHILLKDL